MPKDVSSYKFIEDLKSLSFIDEILLFGSRARGDHQDRSDIDLAIICPLATENDWLNVMEIIEDADTLLKIDCVRCDPSLISLPLYQNILNEGRVLYVKNNS